MNEHEFTYAVRIIASAAMDNAPYGYLVAQIELIPGLLYVESERNPYTEGEWRWAMFVVGDGHPSNNKPLVSVLMATDSGILSELRGRLAVVSALFEGDLSGEWEPEREGRVTMKEALSDLREKLAPHAAGHRIGIGTFRNSTQSVARHLIELTQIVDNIALDTEQRFQALERYMGFK